MYWYASTDAGNSSVTWRYSSTTFILTVYRNRKCSWMKGQNRIEIAIKLKFEFVSTLQRSISITDLRLLDGTGIVIRPGDAGSKCEFYLSKWLQYIVQCQHFREHDVSIWFKLLHVWRWTTELLTNWTWMKWSLKQVRNSPCAHAMRHSKSILISKRGDDRTCGSHHSTCFFFIDCNVWRHLWIIFSKWQHKAPIDKIAPAIISYIFMCGMCVRDNLKPIMNIFIKSIANS